MIPTLMRKQYTYEIVNLSYKIHGASIPPVCKKRQPQQQRETGETTAMTIKNHEMSIQETLKF